MKEVKYKSRYDKIEELKQAYKSRVNDNLSDYGYHVLFSPVEELIKKYPTAGQVPCGLCRENVDTWLQVNGLPICEKCADEIAAIRKKTR